MERYAALIIAAAIVLFWIVAVSPVLVSGVFIVAIALAWCRWLDRPVEHR